MKAKEILTLRPNDYIVYSGGLKIENTSKDLLIELEVPESYKVSPMVITSVPHLTPSTLRKLKWNT